jgi:hypothetical protein
MAALVPFQSILAHPQVAVPALCRFQLAPVTVVPGVLWRSAVAAPLELRMKGVQFV